MDISWEGQAGGGSKRFPEFVLLLQGDIAELTNAIMTPAIFGVGKNEDNKLVYILQ